MYIEENNMLERICKICKKTFLVKSEKTNKLTCSPECRKENKHKLNQKRNHNDWQNPEFRQKKLDYFKTLNGKYSKEKKQKMQIERLKKRKLMLCEKLDNKCFCHKDNFGNELMVTRENLWIFDFHHLNPEEKEREHDWKRKDFDISKVSLLCSNCHRLEHSKQCSISSYQPQKL